MLPTPRSDASFYLLQPKEFVDVKKRNNRPAFVAGGAADVKSFVLRGRSQG